jgi:integrase
MLASVNAKMARSTNSHDRRVLRERRMNRPGALERRAGWKHRDEQSARLAANLPDERLTADRLLLLSRELPPPRRELQERPGQARGEPQPQEVVLPGFQAPAKLRQRTRYPGRKQRRAQYGLADPLLEAYLRRLLAQGPAPKGLRAYRYALRGLLQAAKRLAGAPLTLAELFVWETLLGQALVDDWGFETDRRLSRWTLAQRRSAVRSLATLMRPELLEVLGGDPHAALDRALRSAAVRVGGGYQLTGGSPRCRGGYTPTGQEIVEVVAATGRAPGYAGPRNRAFFAILAETGARVNALRCMDGTDCMLWPSGRLRLFLHEKGKTEPREIELTHDTAETLHQYIDAFNAAAVGRGWRANIQLGCPGPVWRNGPCGVWSYANVCATLRAACQVAGMETFTPHAFRRAFATDGAAALPRHIVALAGGWRGVERMDDAYVNPRASVVWEKLGVGRLRSFAPEGIDIPHAITTPTV